MREKAAMKALDDLLDWLDDSGQLAVLDATVRDGYALWFASTGHLGLCLITQHIYALDHNI